MLKIKKNATNTSQTWFAQELKPFLSDLTVRGACALFVNVIGKDIASISPVLAYNFSTWRMKSIGSVATPIYREFRQQNAKLYLFYFNIILLYQRTKVAY